VLEVLEVLEYKNQKDGDNGEIDDRNKKIQEYQEEEITQQQASKDDPFECYYCRLFTSTKNENEYKNHINLNHPR